MKNYRAIITCLALCTMQSIAFGYYHIGSNKTAPPPSPGVTAGCSPASAATELNINNTRTLIQTGGDMWWNFSDPVYEIPKGGGANALFAGSLWLGGQDVSGQLKVAAQRFRQVGVDFWTGPLSTITSEIEPATCVAYDKHFVTFRDQIILFNAWYEAGLFDKENGTSTQQEDFPGYNIPDTILNWPAHGRNYAPYNEDFYLAPFYDRNGDGVYNPLDGDYPGYDLKNEIDCSERIANIYGDMNLWWVFNDKGNVHTETGANSIGMEIRAQAFGFATNDEVNNMTFYNYELINRSTFTLTQTYFGQWVDADLGCYNDDYVGCDVKRGLGYAYNGKAVDQSCQGAQGYGDQPPAIGVDFFQGPFQDNDGLDNPGPTAANGFFVSYQDAVNQLGIPYKGIGIGYGDQLVDNERFGMRRFLYHNNQGPNCCNDPGTGVDYYNYLRGIWKDGTQMLYGGNGHIQNGGDPNTPALYMFPDDTDPIAFGTSGVPQAPWTEVSAGNTEGDRRFIQSAGPFTLSPGQLNYITVGVVWARALSGGPFGSVQELRRADDKTQAMFDNCFRVLNGPDAPDITIQELDKELILYLSNKKVSNNFNEEYTEVSPFIFPPDSINGQPITPEQHEDLRTYTFQGYLVYQLKNQAVSPADLKNPNLARLIAQCDVKDGVGQIINLYYDQKLDANVPVEEVNGADKGIRHSFQVKDDEFASGNKRLVNHKTYYFMVLGYAHNDAGSLTPNDPYLYVQQPFLASRKSAVGGIKVYSGIPHKTDVEAGGTKLNSQYGDGVELTRIEGQGNNGKWLELKKESIDEIMEGAPWKASNPTYERSEGPIDVKVIDPLNVPAADFTIAFYDSTSKTTSTWADLTDAYWAMWRNDLGDTVWADKAVAVQNEQLLLNWGLSVTITQSSNPSKSTTNPSTYGDAVLGGEISYRDVNLSWLTGVADQDGCGPQNWIRSGTLDDPNDATCNDYAGWDDDQKYENIAGPNMVPGTWAPFQLTANNRHGPMHQKNVIARDLNKMEYLHSVDIVFTPDKSKWSRCPVLEMQGKNNLAQGDPAPNKPDSSCVAFMRDAPSVDKNGVPGGGDTINENSPNYIGAIGMGWFPGYAINVETGERLNIAFGEDSWLAAENGADMIWNPTDRIFEGPLNDVRFGGKHYIFVFRNNVVEDETVNGLNNPADRMPAYDGGAWMLKQLLSYKYTNTLSMNPQAGFRNLWRSCSWVGLPLLLPGEKLLSVANGLIPTETTVKIRVTKPFQPYGTTTLLGESDNLTVGDKYLVYQGPVDHDSVIYKPRQWFTATATGFVGSGGATDDHKDLLYPTVNYGLPMYNFSTHDLAAVQDSLALAIAALDLIGVVPNPYYAYSEYEQDKLDNRIKVINLPQTCTVTIYTVNGTLIRRLEKDDPTITSLDWDLKNQAQVPIASGLYIIHVNVPGVGERILKWFGSLRPVDLDAF